MATSSATKRKLDLGSPKGSQVFPIFSPALSPSKALRSPSSSPSKKRANLTLKQGASQSNKILRYLQPKRLLPSFEKQETCVVPLSPISVNNNNEHEDKENVGLELKVTLKRLDDHTYHEHSYCVMHLSPKKYCCDAASEYVTQAIENIVVEDAENPCKRLGIPSPSCIGSEGCLHIENEGTVLSYQDSLYSSMVDADLQVAMVRACYQDLSPKAYPSPCTIHLIFNIMKNSADKSIIALGKNFLKRVIEYHPPCTLKMKYYYLQVLHSSQIRISMPKELWALRTLDFFDNVLRELEDHIEGSLNPAQRKESCKLPGARKVRKPKRYLQSPSPKKQKSRKRSDNYDAETEEASNSTENIKTMSKEEMTEHIFSRFEILVDVLEWDLVVWLSKNSGHSKIRDRSVCPLVVLALWPPESDTAFDSIHCRRIFSMYISAWILKFHPRHIRTLGRLVGLIAEVTSASEPNTYQYPHVGEGCHNLARKLCEGLKNTHLEESRTKAVSMLKPVWLKMLVSAKLLDVHPSTSSIEIKTLLKPMNETSIQLWAHFLDAVLDFHHVREAMRLSKQASCGLLKEKPILACPAININYEVLHQEIEAYFNLTCQLDRYTNIDSLPRLLSELLSL